MDRAIALLADRQHGVVALAQLLELGLSARAVRGRVRSGRLHRIHRGVYAVGHSVLSRKGWWMAAVLACGGGAVLSHRSAAALHELRWDNRSVADVIVPGARRRRDGIVPHRAAGLELADVTVVDGIPCTTVARTLLDLAEILDRQALRRACNEAEVLRVFDGRALEHVLRRAHGRRGVPRLRALLADGRIGEAITRNDLEEAFLALCDHAGLPAPEVNAWIPLPDGDGYEADFLWPEQRLNAETDGGGVHDTPSSFEADRRRDQRLMRAGYRVVRFTWWQVFHAQDEVVDTLRDLIAA